MQRIRRFAFLTVLAGLGAILFVPFLRAGAPTPISTSAAAVFVAFATTIAAIATWLGLGWADRAELPMSMLRAFESKSRWPISTVGLSSAAAVGIGIGIGLFGLALFAIFDLPSSTASFAVRVGSALFAAVTLETVLHLAIMSGVVAATRSIRAGIVVSTAAYIGFHLMSLGGQESTIILAATIGNGAAGLLFGWLYARYGFEYLVLAHLMAHTITVGFA